MDLKSEVYSTKRSQGTTGSVYNGPSDYLNSCNEQMNSQGHYKTSCSSRRHDKANWNKNNGVVAQAVKAPPGFVTGSDGKVYYSQILVPENDHADPYLENEIPTQKPKKKKVSCCCRLFQVAGIVLMIAFYIFAIFLLLIFALIIYGIYYFITNWRSIVR